MVKSQTHGECFSDTYCYNTVIVKIDTGPMFEMVTVPPVKCLDDRCISEEYLTAYIRAFSLYCFFLFICLTLARG